MRSSHKRLNICRGQLVDNTECRYGAAADARARTHKHTNLDKGVIPERNYSRDKPTDALGFPWRSCLRGAKEKERKEEKNPEVYIYISEFQSQTHRKQSLAFSNVHAHTSMHACGRERRSCTIDFVLRGKASKDPLEKLDLSRKMQFAMTRREQACSL